MNGSFLTKFITNDTGLWSVHYSDSCGWTGDQEIEKITSEDKTLCFLLVLSELWRYHSHEHLACIAMANTSKFSFHKCIWERLAHTIQFKF